VIGRSDLDALAVAAHELQNPVGYESPTLSTPENAMDYRRIVPEMYTMRRADQP